MEHECDNSAAMTRSIREGKGLRGWEKASQPLNMTSHASVCYVWCVVVHGATLAVKSLFSSLNSLVSFQWDL